MPILKNITNNRNYNNQNTAIPIIILHLGLDFKFTQICKPKLVLNPSFKNTKKEQSKQELYNWMLIVLNYFSSKRKKQAIFSK